MKRLLMLALSASLVHSFLRFTQAQADDLSDNQFPAVTEKLTAAHMREDFDLMRKSLEEAHTGLYRYSTKDQMDRAFATQRAKLNRPLTKMEYLLLMSQTAAMIRCGHTSIDPDEGMKKELDTIPMLPLRGRVEDGRLVVLFNDTPDDRTILPGMEVIKINGHDVAGILHRIWPFESADGDIETGKPMHITNFFPLFYWALLEHTDQFVIEARPEAGKIVTAKLTGVTRAERASNQNPVNASAKAALNVLNWTPENQGLRFLKDPEIAEIRIRYFIGSDFPQWVEATFKTLREKNAKTLIIDLRGNGGGQDEYGAVLVSYLTDKPFRYFDHINIKTITPSFKEHSDWNAADETRLRDGAIANPAGGYLVTEKLHPGLAEQLPGRTPFLGKVFVLIDGGTFSTILIKVCACNSSK